MYLYKDMHKISCYLNGKVYYVKKKPLILIKSSTKLALLSKCLSFSLTTYLFMLDGRVFQQTVSTPTGKPMLFMDILSLSFLTSVSGPTQPDT